MLALLGLGEIEGAGLENAASMAGLLFQLLVERHRVVLETACIGRVVQAVDVGGRMPCRA